MMRHAIARAAKGVWNGPFYVGKLARPASLGDVLLKVLETLWRTLVLMLAVPCFAGALYALNAYFIEPVFFPPLSSKVAATAAYGDGFPVAVVNGKPFKCDEIYPVRVSFTNNSTKRVSRISFSVEAQQPGHSSNLATNASYLESDAVLEPGWAYNQCYNFEVKEGYKAKDLLYRVVIHTAE
jgi:hypothetical protein